MADGKKKKPAARRAKAARASRTGAESLELVRQLVDQLDALGKDDPRVEKLRAEARTLTPVEAVDALEAWLAQHAAVLTVKRGQATDAFAAVAERHGKLPRLYQLLLERFGGFLELAIDPVHWPHRSNEDGLRVLGVAGEHPPCDLAAQLPRFQATVASAAQYAIGATKKQAERWAKMVPIITTLEGVRDAWVAGGSDIDQFGYGRVLIHAERLGVADRDLPTHPRMGPPFALIARLVQLERRLALLGRRKAVERVVAQVAPIEVDGRGRLQFVNEPELSIGFAAGTGTPPPGTVVVFCEIAKVPMHAGAIAPMFEKRIVAANHAARGVKLFESIEWLWARTDLLEEGLTAAEVAAALARVRRASDAFRRSTSFDFDAEVRPFPDGVAALLAAAGADAQGFNRRFLSKDRLPRVREVVCVGKEHPRVRWSFTAAREPNFTAFSHATLADLWPATRRPDSDCFQAELLCSALTPARIEALMGQMPIAERRNTWSDYNNEEQAQLSRTLLARTEGTQRALDVAGSDPTASDFWRVVAATSPLTADRLAEMIREHQSWLGSKPSPQHVWESLSWLNLELALYRSERSTQLQADFTLRDLRALSLADLELTACKMVHTLAEGVDFSRAKLDHAMVTSSDLRRARFDGARLVGSDFSRSRFNGASFKNADCTGVDFEACDLTGCDFTGAKLDGIKTQDAISPPGSATRG